MCPRCKIEVEYYYEECPKCGSGIVDTNDVNFLEWSNEYDSDGF